MASSSSSLFSSTFSVLSPSFFLFFSSAFDSVLSGDPTSSIFLLLFILLSTHSFVRELGIELLLALLGGLPAFRFSFELSFLLSLTFYAFPPLFSMHFGHV